MKLTSSMAGKDPPPGDQGPCLHCSFGGLLPSWIISFQTPPPNIPFPCQDSPSQEPPPPGPLLIPPGPPPPPSLCPPLLRLPWYQVLAFAAAVAQDGFNVTHDLGQWGLGGQGKGMRLMEGGDRTSEIWCPNQKAPLFQFAPQISPTLIRRQTQMRRSREAHIYPTSPITGSLGVGA